MINRICCQVAQGAKVSSTLTNVGATLANAPLTLVPLLGTLTQVRNQFQMLKVLW